MNKINPLYLLISLSVIALIMISLSLSTQTRLGEVAKESAILEVNGKYISSLKKRWKNPKKSKQSIERILSMRQFKENIVSKNFSKGIYKLELETLDVVRLDSFVNKILAQSVEIKSLQINRMSDKNASLTMECRI